MCHIITFLQATVVYGARICYIIISLQAPVINGVRVCHIITSLKVTVIYGVWKWHIVTSPQGYVIYGVRIWWHLPGPHLSLHPAPVGRSIDPSNPGYHITEADVKLIIDVQHAKKLNVTNHSDFGIPLQSSHSLLCRHCVGGSVLSNNSATWTHFNAFKQHFLNTLSSILTPF